VLCFILLNSDLATCSGEGDNAKILILVSYC
jgi:hypothetical protein